MDISAIVTDVPEYVRWFDKAKRGEACIYYSFSLENLNEHTLSQVRELALHKDAEENLIRITKLADYVMNDSNFKSVLLRFKGLGLVTLITRAKNGRRELMAVKL